VALKAHFKGGLSLLLSANFPNYTPVLLPDYNLNLGLMYIFYICSFINTDGSFFLLVSSDSRATLGLRARLKIVLTQHTISLIVLQAIIAYPGLEVLKPKSEKPAYRLRISSLK
jgi:hypothetical protein